jgi:hypothetical protein
MSNTQYLEIDSTYRNRQSWPKPSKFDVLIAQSGRRSGTDAFDPVSLAAPITCWKSNDFHGDGSAKTNVVFSVAGTNNTTSCFIADAGNSGASAIDNYYLNIVALSSAPTERRHITSYEYLGENHARISVTPPFSNTPTSNITLTDPTDRSSYTNSRFFVPNGRKGENSYNGCLLFNESLGEHLPILGYNETDHTVEIEKKTGWSTDHIYCIRDSTPLMSLTATAATINSFDIPNGSITDDFYNGKYIRIRITEFPVEAPQGEIRRIVDYVGENVVNGVTTTTLTATTEAFSTTPSETATFEILDVSYDNHNPFSYNGSVVSQQQNVGYQLELLNLTLPNQTLSTGHGSTLAFYPYVYVELRSAGSNYTPGSIYSNNPNSSNALFRVSIDDITNTSTSTFIKIDGSCMVQTIKFKINDNLHFAVYLPNGDLFGTTLKEILSPLKPNPLVQISALFSLKKL